MNFLDLHCDTLYEAYTKNKSLLNGDLHVNFEKISRFENYVGCFAIWIPDELSEDKSFEFFKNIIRFYQKNKYLNFNKKAKIILTLEGTKCIGEDLSRIKFIKDCGIRIVTLTWNGSYRVGDGCMVKNARGLSDFGKLVVEELEKNQIIIDLSHASEKLFYDVCSISTKPVIVSHSNSRTICNNPRNLTDDQFKTITKKGGVVGVNFCRYFVSKKPNPTLKDLRAHIEHFMSLGEKNSICIGSDFDGTDIIDQINDVTSIEKMLGLVDSNILYNRIVLEILTSSRMEHNIDRGNY